ncbi:MAG: hypothetical protein AVO38_11000 [delta proteobacterium ML8_D]|nr:MAG: hypothetical protein AVO34_05390 [Firmicutes bacterium ML8_F2]OPL15114.1 MAG: hypothetical protein AVO38_11000 [delta proteobacterium ML8_D]
MSKLNLNIPDGIEKDPITGDFVVVENVKPLRALGDTLILNRLEAIRPDGGVRPLSALGYTTNTSEYSLLWGKLQDALQSLGLTKHGLYHLREVLADTIIYQAGDKIYKRGFTIDGDGIVRLGDEATKVTEDERKALPSSSLTATSRNNDEVQPMSALGFTSKK